MSSAQSQRPGSRVRDGFYKPEKLLAPKPGREGKTGRRYRYWLLEYQETRESGKGVPSQEDKETGLGKPRQQASAISHGSPGRT